MIRRLFQEAGFGTNIIKGLELVASQLGKRTGNSYNLSNISEPYKNNHGEFNGYNMFANNKRLRFNLELGSSTSNIYSVDIWNNMKDLPDRTLLLNGFNILQVLDELVDVINGTLEEGRRKTTDVKPSRGKRIKTKREKLMEKFGVTDMTSSDKYTQLSSYIKMVAKGYKNSLIITGEPGLSKTTTVRDTIKDSGVDYAWGGGANMKSASDLYKVLYSNNNKIIVFDDTDYLVHRTKGRRFREILLAATELQKKRSLQIKDLKDKDIKSEMNPKGKYPQNFQYEGGLIFITNLDPKYIEPSLESRSLMISMKFTKYEVLEMIKEGLTKYYKEVPVNIKVEVLDFLNEVIDVTENFDFRKYRDVLMLRMSGDSNWQKWAFSII